MPVSFGGSLRSAVAASRDVIAKAGVTTDRIVGELAKIAFTLDLAERLGPSGLSLSNSRQD